MTLSHPAGEPPLDQPYPGAPFSAALARFWKKGLTFTGRASRSEYWFGYLASVVPFVVLYIFSGITAFSYSTMGFSTFLLFVAVLYGLATMVPILAATVRRLHDAGYSGAYYFVGFIPIVGGILLLVLLAQESKPDGARFDVPGTVSHVAPVSIAPPPAPAYGPPPAAAAAPVPPPPAASALPVPPPPPTSPVVAPPPPPTSVPAESAWAVPPAPPAPVSAPPAWAAPPPPAAPAAPAPAAAFAPPPAPVTPLDETRVATSASGWMLLLPDGRQLPVAGSVYVGRSPVAPDDRPGALLVPVDEATKSMSKTHASIVATATGIEVTDLHSTNGTTITRPDGETSLVPGVATLVAGDTTITFGDWSVQLRRRP